MEKSTCTTAESTSRPSARSIKYWAASLPMCAPLICTVLKAGNMSATKGTSPKPMIASRPGTAICRARASVATPTASRSELQNTASASGHSCTRRARASRPLRSERCAPTLTTCTGGKPACSAASAKAAARRAARSSSAVTSARRLRPLATKNCATARPISRCEKPTSMSMGVGVRSQVSTTGMPEATRRVRPLPAPMMPVRKMPSGRRPMMASSSNSSRSAQ